MNQAAENCRSRPAKLGIRQLLTELIQRSCAQFELNLQYRLEPAKMARAEQADESRLTHTRSAGRRPAVTTGNWKGPERQPSARAP